MTSSTPDDSLDIVKKEDFAAKKIAFGGFLNEPTKYSVFALFVLYAVGFVIWHVHLGNYGVSSIGFLQSEYLSAAFCYLFILVAFAAPPALIYEQYIAREWKAEDCHNINIVTILWYFLALRLTELFFPVVPGSQIPGRFVWPIVCLSCIHIGASIIWKEKGKGNSNWRFVFHPSWMAVYLVAGIVLPLFFNRSVNRGFLFNTLLLYGSFMMAFNYNFQGFWKKSPLLLKTIIVSFIALVFVGNVRSFAATQFSKIPKQVGGGQPEKAFLRFALNTPPLPVPLSFTNGHFFSNSFFGPVAILFRDDKEIVFVEDAAFDQPIASTNVTRKLTTNITEKLETNSIPLPRPLQMINRFKVTNIIETFTTNVVENPKNVTATQIRAGLVDVIKFVK